MKKSRKIIILVILVMFIATVFTGCKQDLGSGDIVEIDIFHTSDIHGYMGEDNKKMGYSKLRGYIESFNNDGHMLIDSGDLLEGSIFSNLDNGASAVAMVNAMGYDAIAPGNHEFNFGNKQLFEFSQSLNAPLVSANIRLNGQLAFAPYIIKEIKGVKIGVFGLTIPDRIYDTKDGYNYDLGNKASIIEDAKIQIAALKEAGADIIIASTHLGSIGKLSVSSKDIAKNVNDIDIILDGHSHSLYKNGKNVKGVVLSSVGEHLKNIGVIHISYNKDNNKKNIKAKTISKSKIKTQDNQDIKVLYQELADKQKDILNEPITNLNFDIKGGKSSLKSLTELGKAVSNAFLKETNADIALFDGACVGAKDLKSGTVTYSNILNAIPYKDIVLTLELTGKELKTVITDLLKYNQSCFMQFSGFTVEVKEKVNFSPKYQIVSVKFNGKEINDNDKFVVATTDYCCKYSSTLYEKEAINLYDNMQDVTMNYLKNTSSEEIKNDIEENNLIIKTNPLRIILICFTVIAFIGIIIIVVIVIIKKIKQRKARIN